MTEQAKNQTVSNPVEAVVMTHGQLYSNALSEHIDNNAEALKRLMLLIADASPHISHLISDLMEQWHEINSEINEELQQKIKESDAS